MKCQADPACPYPTSCGSALCAYHQIESSFSHTVHEMSHEGVRRLTAETWGGFSVNTKISPTDVVGRPKKEAKKCRVCKRVIPDKESICGACLRRLLPIKESMMEKLASPSRKHLPDTRSGLTHKFAVDGVKCWLRVGLYEDGSLGEIFLTIDKMGSNLHGFAESWATLFSVALQYGIPLEVLVAKSKHVKFDPRGVTSNKRNDELRFADSIVDYIAKWLELRFIDKKAPASEPAGDSSVQNS